MRNHEKSKENSKLSTQQESAHSLRHSRIDLLRDKCSCAIHIGRFGQLRNI